MIGQNGWITVAEIAARFGQAESAIADLVRSHHWPRVYAGGAVLVGVGMEVVERALSGSTATIHGSLPAR